jgi:eukaryotic-like serine/threonine-protein kinase
MPPSTSRDEAETAVVGPSAGASSDASGTGAGGAGAIAMAARIGEQLGRYLVIEELGRGGMGVVLRAYDPKLQREVALKLVRTDTLEPAAEARLVREARAMARLAHPNVVAVYDVELGTDVMVVMEYVPGTTLGRWLEAQPRAYAEIVERFIAAGRGLAAAHAEGLLHRDFKLDNVLVGEDARVRVTDFGLARVSALWRESGAGSVDVADARASSEDVRPSEDGGTVELTAAGTVMGTPRYMAPEQSEDREIDARADQYAFCVALWRGLTERWPFEGRRWALQEAKRGGPPRWPSDVAVPRHVLEALCRGLSPEPAQRWPSMPALLAELGRDPSRRRRRVLATGVLALLAVGAWGVQRVQRTRTAAACVSEGAAIEAVWNDSRAETIATAFEKTGLSYAADTWSRSRIRVDAYAEEWMSTRRTTCEQAELERTLAPELARASRACMDEHLDDLDALLQQLEVLDAAAVQKAATATASLRLVRACTDENVLRHRIEPPSDPAVREELRALRSRLSHASAARATGRYAEALDEAEAVLEEARGLAWAPMVVEAKLAVADARNELGQYEEARAGYEEVFFEAGASARDEQALTAATGLVFILGRRLAQYDASRYWGRVSQMLVDRLGRADDLAVARLLNGLAAVDDAKGAYGEARALYERALAIRENTFGPDHPHVAMSLNNLATVHQQTGAYDEAKALYGRAIDILEEGIGHDHPHVATILANLGRVYEHTGEYDDAKVLQERALVIQEKALGPDHPKVAMSLTNLANAHFAKGGYDEAKALQERALAIREKTLGPDHPHVAESLHNLANVHQETGAYEEAQARYERALSILEKAVGPDHPKVAESLHNLAVLQKKKGAYDEAKVLQERALSILEKAVGPDHPKVAESLTNLANVHRAMDAHDEAKVLHQQAIAILEKAVGPDHPLLGTSLHNLANVHRAMDAHDEAKALYERALSIFEKAVGPDHPHVTYPLVGLVEVALAQRRTGDAVELARRAVLLCEAGRASLVELAEARFSLARALAETGAPLQETITLAEQARDAYREAGSDDALNEIERWLDAHRRR